MSLDRHENIVSHACQVTPGRQYIGEVGKTDNGLVMVTTYIPHDKCITYLTLGTINSSLGLKIETNMTPDSLI